MRFSSVNRCAYISLRNGALIMAVLQFLISGILAIALWSEAAKWGQDVGVRITGTSAAAATYYSILCFSALIGTFAIITRSRDVLKYFAFCLGWSLGVQLCVSAIHLWGFLSTPRETLLPRCQQILGMDPNLCVRAFQYSIGWLLASVIVGLLVQLCSAYVVSTYSSRLSNNEEEIQDAPAANISAPELVAHAAIPAVHFRRSQIMAFALSEKEKEWAASPTASFDSSNEGSDDHDAEVRFDPGPPPAPMLEPAPPKRIRSNPSSQSSSAATSPARSEVMATSLTITARENPFADERTVAHPPGLALQAISESTPSKATGPPKPDPATMV